MNKSLFIACLLLSHSVFAKTLISPPSRPIMMELYTSQGCSSCPPAERWLSHFSQQYRAKPELWQQTIPINFHVDYWDYLGWPDPFANKAFSQRQRLYKKLGHSRNVATPGFIVDGQAWNGWFYRQPMPSLRHQASGIIRAEINQQQCSVQYRSKQASSNLKLHIAILGFGQKIQIRRGENHGKTLQHDFVVLGYKVKNIEANKPALTLNLPSIGNFNSKEKAVVIWISQGHDPKPVQAVADWL